MLLFFFQCVMDCTYGFEFFLQACADIKGSESSVESVECIAEWKEGSTYYFLGKKTIYNKTIKHFHT